MAAADVPDQVAHDVIGRVLAAPVTRGEALTLVRFVGPDLAEASTGDVVLPVRLPDAAMAALLRPGDVVDLFATDPGTGQARVVATNVDVLTAAAASSPSPVSGATSGSEGALVVLGVSSAQSLAVTGAALSQYLTVGY